MTGTILADFLLYFLFTTYMIITQTDSGTVFEKFSGEGNVFNSSSAGKYSAFECARECIQSQPLCIGFTYEDKKSCQLLDSVIRNSSSSDNTWISGNE